MNLEKASPFVSIIIPVYRDVANLKRCLAALAAQTCSPEKFEVVVINNAPETPLPPLAGIRHLRQLMEARAGSYAARNTGIQAAQGTLLGFCDADCIPAPNWIVQAVDFLTHQPAFARLGGRIHLFQAHPTHPTWAEKHEQVFAFHQAEYVRQGWAATANMFAWRHVFEVVGLFDTRLLSGGDLEWGRRAETSGFAIGYAHDVLVKHPARRSVQALIQKARRVMAGYAAIQHAESGPGGILYQGLILLKPPLKAAALIRMQSRFSLTDKLGVYGLEYLLKLVQLGVLMGRYSELRSGFWTIPHPKRSSV